MSVLAGSGVLAVLALVGPLGLGSAMAAPCAPSVQVSGDPALVATVGELLVRHGISNEGEGCPVVRVRLEHRGEEIVVFRLGEPTDIARAVAFLAGPGASYITGETLHVNGGMYMA